MRRLATAGLIAALALVTACTNDKSLLNPTGTSSGPFKQLDSMGRPLIVEIYSPWADHDAIVRGAPASDSGKLATDITAFVTAAGRSPAIVTFDTQLLATGSSLTPAAGNVLLADISQTTPANYLALETNGKSSPTGSLFRRPRAQ